VVLIDLRPCVWPQWQSIRPPPSSRRRLQRLLTGNSGLGAETSFNGHAGKDDADIPRSHVEYGTKAGHLLGLLPPEAPLFVGFQELGSGEDVAALAHSATARYGRPYRALFVSVVIIFPVSALTITAIDDGRWRYEKKRGFWRRMPGRRRWWLCR
jgi:hypothetical protein